ncbi:hypothetical protein IWW38_003334 [Coemansia aciculifera]|uniref:Uncharacterized protein n=1 Tax=Coemansia aciculifera TaxID=417176 RepID=A0ACC1M1Z3_9FUNG|nr:hypothetical protein IWW38_003334 [Coemansia aciculifera]
MNTVGAARLGGRAAAIPRLSASMVVTAPIAGAAAAATASTSLYNYRVLMVRRLAAGGSFDNALVFPGGIEEASDSQDAKQWQQQHTNSHKVCAIRETFEETGLLLTTPPATATQGIVRRQAEAFGALCTQLRVRPLDVRFMGRWITPRAMAQRFDTRFFMYNISDSDEFLQSQLDSGRLQESEVASMDWVSPDAVLRANAQSGVVLFPPQFLILSEIARYKRWQDLLSRYRDNSSEAESAAAAIEPVLCRRSDGHVVALLPGDHAYPAMDNHCLHAPAIRDADLFDDHHATVDPAGIMRRIVMKPASNPGGGFYAARLIAAQARL